MKLTLKHCKNVDLMYGQGNGTGYWEYPCDPRTTTLEVATIADASKALREWVNRNGLGSGNMAKGCGKVTDGKRVVAFIGYNGRAWSHEYGHPDRKEIEVAA
jgi:hypothetical protein